MAHSSINFEVSKHSTPIKPNAGMFGIDYESRKRRQISSPEAAALQCAKCEDELTENHITCQNCNLRFCSRCANISKKVMELIIVGEIQDYNYMCKICKKTFPSLSNINDKLAKMEDNQERRLCDLEVRMDRMEIGSKELLENNIDHIEKNVISKIEGQINSIVEKKNKEYDDRRRRELNIVVFNLKEGSNSDGLVNKKWDEDRIRHIAEGLGVSDLQIETSYRLGKKNESNKFRVLKVVLKDKKQRKSLLEGSKNITSKLDKNLNKVVIAKDLTPEQREERKVKRDKEKILQNNRQMVTDEGMCTSNNGGKNIISRGRNGNGNKDENKELEDEIQDPYSDETLRSLDRTISNLEKSVLVHKAPPRSRSNSINRNNSITDVADSGSILADDTVIGGVPSQPVQNEVPRVQPGRD